MRILQQQSTKRKKKSKIKGEVEVLSREEFDSLALDPKVLLIQSLVPLGLLFIRDVIEQEVAEIVGPRYQRLESPREVYRHGSNPGSVKLGGQKIPLAVPRVRAKGKEISLESYQAFHQGADVDEYLLRHVIHGISCRNNASTVEKVPGAIGLSKSTVSKEFVQATQEQLKQFQERDLHNLDIIAIFPDGKTFAEDTMVVALGITMSGEKIFLGFIQTATENEKTLSIFLQSLLDRGLDISRGILTIVDGAKGMIAAIKKRFKKQALIQRCQWHKRENIVSFLPKEEQASLRKRLQKADEKPTEKEARKALMKIHNELELCNQSAVRSFDEGFEETLTLHRLGVFPLLGRSFKTTNCLESVNAMAEEKCAKVDYWKNSNQNERWLAASLADIQPRLNKISGYKHLHKLRAAIMDKLGLSVHDQVEDDAA
jgi:transposase-like protein